MKVSKFNHIVSLEYRNLFSQDPHQPSSDAVVVVGAASKGIIKRDQQNNAVVYKTYYGQNPFAHMDKDEIEKYKREVEQNQMREQGLSLIIFIQFHIFFLQHLKRTLY